VHVETVAAAQPPAHRRVAEPRVPRPAHSRRRPAAADGHVGAAIQLRDEARQIPGVHRPVTVEHRHDQRRRRHDPCVHGGAISGQGLGDDLRTQPPGHFGRAVGAVVVDHQGQVARRHVGQHSGQ
jgi:hypothetical protein